MKMVTEWKYIQFFFFCSKNADHRDTIKMGFDLIKDHNFKVAIICFNINNVSTVLCTLKLEEIVQHLGIYPISLPLSMTIQKDSLLVKNLQRIITSPSLSSSALLNFMVSLSLFFNSCFQQQISKNPVLLCSLAG